jgi:hypothetical protein
MAAHTQAKQAQTNKSQKSRKNQIRRSTFLASPNRCVFSYISITMDRRNPMVESLDTHQGYRTTGEIAIALDVMNMSET